MLKMANLTKPFWKEALLTAYYLLNQSPLAPLDYDIPKRVWTGKEVCYSHFKVFGCIAHVPKEQRQKLDDKSIECIFLGNGDAEFGYRLWDPVKKKIVISRNVVFHEHEILPDYEVIKKSSANIIITPSTVSPSTTHAT